MQDTRSSILFNRNFIAQYYLGNLVDKKHKIDLKIFYLQFIATQD